MTHPHPAPRLILVAHGTRSAAGRRTICRVFLETRKRLPGVDARLAWVDVQSPGPDRVLADGVPSVVVPAFLARGYHVVSDVAGAVRRAPGPVAVSEHLGDAPEIRAALVQRLAEAGGTTCDGVVLAVAGSRDPGAGVEIAGLARGLGEILGVPAAHGMASAGEPTVAEAVAGLRGAGCRRVAVATHLLAPGFFADRITRSAESAGAVVVSAPLGPCVPVVDLLVRRYSEKRESVPDPG